MARAAKLFAIYFEGMNAPLRGEPSYLRYAANAMIVGHLRRMADYISTATVENMTPRDRERFDRLALHTYNQIVVVAAEHNSVMFVDLGKKGEQP